MKASRIVKANDAAFNSERTVFLFEMQSFSFKPGLSAFPAAEGLFLSAFLCYTFPVNFKV